MNWDYMYNLPPNIEYVVLLVVIGMMVYARKAIDLLGCIFMVIMGVIIIFAPNAGYEWLFLIFIFLLLGLLFTKYKHQYKKEIGVYEGTRTIRNVVSNGIIPFIMAAFGNYGGFIGSIATATADTMASEVGVTTTPRLITTFKKVPPGTDGGISILGTVAGIVGAGIIGVASSYLLGLDPVKTLEIAVISGTVGCFVDSILGAVLESKKYLNNEHVNLIATLCGALIGIILV